MHAKGSAGQVAPAPEVGEHGVDAVVVACDRIAPWNVPVDVSGQQRPDRRLIPAGVESSLSRMQPAKQLYGLSSIHGSATVTEAAACPKALANEASVDRACGGCPRPAGLGPGLVGRCRPA
jgi:hypothetical protein